MSLKELRNEAKAIHEELISMKSSKYDLARDKRGNLYLLYADGKRVKMPLIDLRSYQEEVQVKLYLEDMKRFFLIRPRRSGKEVESFTMIIEGALVSPGLYLMIYPTNVRARMVLWEGAILLQDKGSLKFLDMIPAHLIQSFNNQEMSIKLVNGSIIRIIGSDIDPDKLRGTNPLGIVISEFAFCDPRVMYILLPILRQNGGWLILQSTFNGRNHAYSLYKEIKDNPQWYCRVDSVDSLMDDKGNRYITDAMIDEDRKSGMPEHLIQQEYYSSVQLNEEAIYFARQMLFLEENSRIISDYYLPNVRVYTATDKGRNDSNVMILFQLDGLGQPLVIDCIEDTGKLPDFYFAEARKRATKLGLYIHSHFYPHDGGNREYGTGKNMVDFGQEAGEIVKIVPRPLRKIDAIQQMRKMIYRTKFHKENTQRLLDAMSNYTKTFNEKMGAFQDEPKHDWASHPVDAYQTMTLAIDSGMISDRPKDVIYYTQ